MKMRKETDSVRGKRTGNRSRAGILLAAVFCAGMMLTGCGSKSKLPEGFDESTVKTQAEADIRTGESNDYEAWLARFEDSLQSQITPEAYEAYEQVLEDKGAFKSFEKAVFAGAEQDGKKYAMVIYTVSHDNGELKYTLGYDEGMKLVQYVAQ